jgi:hypothetical protein
MECSHLKIFPIIDEFLIQHVVDRKLCEELILPIIQLSIIQSFSLILFLYILVGLKLLEWLHWIL